MKSWIIQVILFCWFSRMVQTMEAGAWAENYGTRASRLFDEVVYLHIFVRQPEHGQVLLVSNHWYSWRAFVKC